MHTCFVKATECVHEELAASPTAKRSPQRGQGSAGPTSSPVRNAAGAGHSPGSFVPSGHERGPVPGTVLSATDAAPHKQDPLGLELLASPLDERKTTSYASLEQGSPKEGEQGER